MLAFDWYQAASFQFQGFFFRSELRTESRSDKLRFRNRNFTISFFFLKMIKIKKFRGDEEKIFVNFFLSRDEKEAATAADDEFVRLSSRKCRLKTQLLLSC